METPGGTADNQINIIIAMDAIAKKTTDTKMYRGTQVETGHFLFIAKLSSIDTPKHHNTKNSGKTKHREIERKLEKYTKKQQSKHNTKRKEERMTK